MKILKSLLLMGVLLLSVQGVFAQVSVGGYTISSQTTANAGAVVCTMDAMLCPDGVTYVGRTGPSCAFICPDDGDIPPVTSNECVDLKNNMFTRSRDSQTNGEVSKLQDFLSPEYFDQDPTGFFGRRTLDGVKSFQRDNGLRAFGYVGPATRAKIKQLTCSGTLKTIQIKSLSPSIGLIGTEVAIRGDGINVGGDQIYFGGSLITEAVSASVDRVNVLRFRVPGSITPCGVGGQNLCKIASRPVTQGSYEVVVVNSRGTSNTLSFTVTSSTTNPPIISGVSGPQTLNVNQQGTWTVTASNPSGGNISYSVVWGDEGTVARTGITTPQQTATFTHAYSRAGLYTPRFTVTNANGQSATASLSVNVGNTTVQNPAISSLSPSVGVTGTQVTITGTGFTSVGNKVNFGQSVNVNGPYNSSDGKTITFVVPGYSSNTGGANQPGGYAVSVSNTNGTSNTLNFTVTSVSSNAPSVSSLSPASGSVGTRVIILGTNINTNEEVVTFGGSLNYVDIVQPRQQGRVEFIIPSSIGASCPRFTNIPVCPPGARQSVVPGTYEVAVANRNGVSNRMSFTVTSATVQTPTITSFTPTTVVVGANASIVITGINFNIETFNILRFMNMQGVQVGNASFANTSSPTSVTFPFHSDIIPGTYRLQARVPGNGNNWSPSSDQILTVTSATVQTPLITKFQVENVATTNSFSRKLVWTTQFTSSCTASGGWSGEQPVNGSYSTAFMSQPLMYTLTCVNSQGASVSSSVTEPTTGTAQTPVISSSNPSSVSIGTEIILTGERLNTGGPIVIFGNGRITPSPTRINDSTLTFVVPSLMSRYCAPGLFCTDDMIPVTSGNYDVKVLNSFGMSNAIIVTVSTQTANSPTISSLSQNSGGTGVAVIVYGSDIGFTDTVNFGTIAVVPDQTYKVANQIRFIIPTTLNTCTGICPDLFQPTPLGGYSVSVTNPKGIITNALQYTVTSNGSSSNF